MPLEGALISLDDVLAARQVIEGRLHRTVADLASRGWAVLPEFLRPDAVRALREDAEGLWAAGRFRQAGVGRAAGYAVREDVRGDQVLWLDADSSTPAQDCFWPEIERLRLDLNRELFLGLISFEAHYALYPPGARYEAHLDRFGTSDERMISCTLYLNAGWSAGHGGDLRLHLADRHLDIPPSAGTLVLFRSDTVRHEVLPATRPRFSLTGWFRRRPLRNALLSCLLAALLFTVAPNTTRAAERRMAQRETVVLLHGLGRTPRSMRRLETALARGGYRVVNVKYSAGRKPIDAIADLLDSRLAACRGAAGVRVHFVTHSYGGIVLRYYLETRSFPNLGRVVMLGPPSTGSEMADLLRKIPVVRSIAGPTRRSLGTDSQSLPARLGPVHFELGIIAGNRSLNPLFSWLIPGPDDGMVSVERAKVPGMTDFLVLPHTHSFIMRSREVMAQTGTFLQTGRFDHLEPSRPSS